MVSKCPMNCTHAYQDQVHGPGRRVMNRLAKDAGYRCTVCGAIYVKGASVGKKKKP